MSIIRYLKPLTRNVLASFFTDCHFDESVFLALGGENSIPEERRKITWNAPKMSHFDPHIIQYGSSKHHSFTKACQSNTRSIYLCKESDEVTYLDCECSSPD